MPPLPVAAVPLLPLTAAASLLLLHAANVPNRLCSNRLRCSRSCGPPRFRAEIALGRSCGWSGRPWWSSLTRRRRESTVALGLRRRRCRPQFSPGMRSGNLTAVRGGRGRSWTWPAVVEDGSTPQEARVRVGWSGWKGMKPGHFSFPWGPFHV